MDIRQLKYFVAIVDAGSLSKAAQKLFVAQPSLSQQMAGLEIELKTPLLLRSSQGVTPTAAGSTLYRHARLMMRQLEQLREDVRDHGGSEAGAVAVGLPTTVAAILAIPLFERIRRQFPGIRLQIVESMSGSIGELLANGQLDLALLFRDSETRGMSVIPVFDEALYVFGHTGLALAENETACPLALLANVPLVIPGAASGLRLMIERAFLRENIELNIVADIDSLPTLLGIANAGSACTILPASVFQPGESALVCAPAMRKIIDPVLSRPTSVCWSHALPVSAAALAVRKAIMELIIELHANDAWRGIMLRQPPDAATLPGTL